MGYIFSPISYKGEIERTIWKISQKQQSLVILYVYVCIIHHFPSNLWMCVFVGLYANVCMREFKKSSLDVEPLLL